MRGVVTQGPLKPQECMEMTRKNIATALTLGFLAFTLSVLPVTTADAKCIQEIGSCLAGYSMKGDLGCDAGGMTGEIERCLVICCTTPSEPSATGESESERQQRFAKECAGKGHSWDSAKKQCRPVKNIGKGSTGTGETPAAIIAGCQKQGGTWDAQRRQCRPIHDVGKNPAARAAPAAIVAGCENQGGVWDEEGRRCKKD